MKKLLLPFAILSLALSGCVKDATLESRKIQIVDPNPPAENPDVVSFQSYLPAKFTKTTTMVSTNKTIWNVDDPVYITDGTKRAVYTSLKGGKDSTLLDHFAGDTLSFAKGAEYLAVFPSEMGDFNGEAGAYGLPSERSYYGFDRFGDVPMVAKKTRTLEDGIQELPQDTLHFKNLCGILKINITEPQALVDLYSYLQVKNITFSALQPVCGKGTLTYDGDEPKITLEKNAEPIVIDCNNEMRLTTTAQPVFVYLPEGNYTELSFAYKVKSTSTESQYTTALAKAELYSNYTTPVEIKRGSMTEISIKLMVKPDDKQIPQTSNSMMVFSTGSYWFKPTKAETGESLGEIDKAVLIWESTLDGTQPGDNQVITSVKYNSEKDSVNFIISEFPSDGGNALIGVADESGKILWSYHIWLQKSTAGLLDPVYYDTAGLFPILKVSMGATGSMTSINGGKQQYISQPLLYQWGRKDPFVGQGRDYGTYGAIKVAGTSNTAQDGPVSLETATANPTVFYTTEGNEWCTDPASATWDGPEKSVTDPCPYGYRVMVSDAFTADYISSCKILSNRGIMFADKEQHDAGSTTCVVINFAYSSLIKPTVGTFSTGSGVYCWSRTPGEAEGKARNFYVSSNTPTVNESAHATGYPVRCQLIVSNPE